jgi:DNA-binding transcriptional ArsR family regulator
VPGRAEQQTGPSRTTGGDCDLAVIGALVADRARCRILVALADGRSLSAGRLAAEAEVAPPTASSHLRKLCDAGLLEFEQTGRNRRYRIATPEVAALIEALERLAPATAAHSLDQHRQATAWRRARVCYDHVAGALGVEIMQAMIARGMIARGMIRPAARTRSEADANADAKTSYALTGEGLAFLEALGAMPPLGGMPVRHHVDSTEDGPHLSGALGRMLLSRFVELGWLERQRNQRLHITAQGQAALRERLGIDLEGRPGQQP